MMKKRLLTSMMIAMCALTVNAAPLSVYDIQYTADASGDSSYMDQTVDCDGGIVINKWVGGSTKLTIYDPSNPDGWGGIISKAYDGEFDGIQIGDMISFTNVLVEERSGNTQLTFETASGSGISVLSPGNTLPAGLIVTDSIFSEQYESMKVVLEDVQITVMDLGRYSDNYNLQNGTGDYWAGDYMNVDNGVFDDYHSSVTIGAEFDSISGIIEHKISDEWDYYQMLTEDSSSFVPEPTTMALLAAGAIMVRKRRKTQ